MSWVSEWASGIASIGTGLPRELRIYSLTEFAVYSDIVSIKSTTISISANDVEKLRERDSSQYSGWVIGIISYIYTPIRTPSRLDEMYAETVLPCPQNAPSITMV